MAAFANVESTPNDPPQLVTSHRGPRHLAFTPNGAFAFVTFEGDSRVGAYRVNGNGTLSEVEVESTLPSGYSGANTGAHVLVHPNGRYLYCSNRGHDSLAVFTIAEDGKLTLNQHVATGGKVPRHFDVDQPGRRLVVANQGDDNIANGSLAVFTVGDDGRLAPLGTPLTGLRSPTAVAMVTTTR